MDNPQPPILPDAGGVMLMAGSWCPLLAVHFNTDTLGLLMSILVSCLAIVDYGLKIYNKAKDMNGEGGGSTLQQVEEVIKQIKDDLTDNEPVKPPKTGSDKDGSTPA